MGGGESYHRCSSGYCCGDVLILLYALPRDPPLGVHDALGRMLDPLLHLAARRVLR